MTMMLARGRCRRLVIVTSDVSAGNNDCSVAADVGEGVLTRLLDVSFPPPSSPPRCDDDGLCRSCRCCCFLRRMSAKMSAVVRTFVCCCGSGRGRCSLL